MNELDESKSRIKRLLESKYKSKDWRTKSRFYILFRIKMFFRGKR